MALGTTRWGSYIGVPPVYIIDVLLAAGAAWLAVGLAMQALRPTDASGRGWPGIALAGLLGWACIRLVGTVDPSVTALRDAAPYLYAAAAFLSAAALHRSSPDGRARTVRLLSCALVAHLAWLAAVRLLPGLPLQLPVVNAAQGIHVLDPRGATDANLAGITGAFFLYRWLRDGGRRNLVPVAVSLALVLTEKSRASLLGTALALAVVAWAYTTHRPTESRHDSRRVVVLALLPSLTVAAAILLPMTTAGGKLLSWAGLKPTSSVVDATGIGTARGRQEAWTVVINYIGDSRHVVAGVGFGPDYLGASGARAPLGGNPALRSPHNYLVGTYARLGIIGLALLIGFLSVLLVAALRNRRLAAADDLVFLGVAYTGATFVTAVLGVELESPFCAVPFFWFAGILLSRPARSAAPGTAAAGSRRTGVVPTPAPARR